MMTHLSNPEILITGSTGTIGSQLCQQLSQKGISFRAMSRTLKEAKHIKNLNGCEVVVADFNDSDSLQKALEGMKHAFLLTNSSPKAEQLQLNFVKAAQRTGLEHIVKQSQLKADQDSPVRFLRYHAVVEKQIRESSIHYTFLRSNLFMQGLLGFKKAINRKGTFFGTLGDAKVSLIDIRDIAGVAVEALQGTEHYDKIYTLTGPEALTHSEMADQLAKTLDRPVTYVDVSDDELLGALLQAGFPEWQAHGLIEDYAHYGRGEAKEITDTVAHVTGHRPYRFEDFASDYADVFRVQ